MRGSRQREVPTVVAFKDEDCSARHDHLRGPEAHRIYNLAERCLFHGVCDRRDSPRPGRLARWRGKPRRRLSQTRNGLGCTIGGDHRGGHVRGKAKRLMSASARPRTIAVASPSVPHPHRLGMRTACPSPCMRQRMLRRSRQQLQHRCEPLPCAARSRTAASADRRSHLEHPYTVAFRQARC